MNLHWTGPDSVGFSGHPRVDLWSTGNRRWLNYGTWSYRRHRFPAVLDPPIPVQPAVRWVAVFALAAAIMFVPVLPIKSEDHKARFIPKGLKGRRAMIVSKAECRSVAVTIKDNSENEIETAVPISAAAGDLLIIAPADEFSLITVLCVDVSKQHGFEWRNFTHDGRATHSYCGNPWGEITDTDWRVLDFSPWVSPLATGVIGTMQAYASVGEQCSPYLFLGRDSSNHQLASVGLDRTHEYGEGTTNNFRAAFGREKTLAVKVTDHTIGKVTIMGWVE